MKMPKLNGTIDRRMLINYRVDPELVKGLLPPQLDPIVINGYASGGICLLRLKNIGMKCSPSVFRVTSENAAHRFLVKYKNADNENCCGVYIPRRDTDSTLNILVAGKIFSWPHYAARFDVEEGNGSYKVQMQSKDLNTRLQVEASLTDKFPGDSMFDSIDHASSAFQSCSVGISPSNTSSQFKVIQLKTETWPVRPLHVQKLHSSFFDDTSLFPQGSIHFDHALLMEGIAHEWS
jgi:uncharacterized protein YqjF (DUF2071 family)